MDGCLDRWPRLDGGSRAVCFERIVGGGLFVEAVQPGPVDVPLGVGPGQVGQDAKFLNELLVFGSYLDPDMQTLGDLDLGVAFRSGIPGHTEPDEYAEILLNQADAIGRRFKTIVDGLDWPQRKALLPLRHRSAVINITTENVLDLTDRYEVVYSYGP